MLQQFVATVRWCCNKSLQRCAGVATNRCNDALVLQQFVAMMRSCCNDLMQQNAAGCNVYVATHFTVNDATRLDGSYRVLLQQTYAPGCRLLKSKPSPTAF